MKSITLEALPATIEKIDNGWKEWKNVGLTGIRFHTGRVVEIDGTEQRVTQNAVSSLLKMVKLGTYKGGVNQVSRYMYDNMNNEHVVDSLNSLVQSPVNNSVSVNARSNDDVLLGFDKPNRQYFTAQEIVTPFLHRTYEAAARFGTEARVNEFMLDASNGIRMSLMLKEFVSAEDYGFGVQLTHPFIGSEKTNMSPIIKQGFCDNTIRSAFDMGMLNTNGAYNRYKMMVATVGGMVDGMQEEVVKLEGLKQIEMNQEQWNMLLLRNRITLNDEQHIAMLQGTRNDTESAYGWINGLTFAAHKAEMPVTQRMEMELFAGKLIGTPEKFGLKRYDN